MQNLKLLESLYDNYKTIIKSEDMNYAIYVKIFLLFNVSITNVFYEGVCQQKNIALEPQIIKELKTIEDPELKVNIYDLGLIRKISISSKNYVSIRMIFTKLFCPYGKTLVNKIKKQVGSISKVTGCKVTVDINTRWKKSMLTEEGRKKLKHIYSW